jgi:hypothetical protein
VLIAARVLGRSGRACATNGRSPGARTWRGETLCWRWSATARPPPPAPRLAAAPRPHRVRRVLAGRGAGARSHRVVDSVTAQATRVCSGVGRQFDLAPVGNRPRRRRSGRGCAKNGRAPGGPPEPVEPYAVLTLACRGPLRAMRSSALLPGRIASGGCAHGDAVMREARSHRVVNSVTAHPCCECPEPLKPGKFFGQRNANSLLSETQRAVALCGTGGVDSRPGHPRVSTSHVRTESRPCGSKGAIRLAGVKYLTAGHRRPRICVVVSN